MAQLIQHFNRMARAPRLNDDLVAHNAALFDDERDAAAFERVVGDFEKRFFETVAFY